MSSPFRAPRGRRPGFGRGRDSAGADDTRNDNPESRHRLDGNKESLMPTQDSSQLSGDILLFHEPPRLTEARSIRPPHSIALPSASDLGVGTEVLATFSRSREVPVRWDDIVHMQDVLLEDDDLR